MRCLFSVLALIFVLTDAKGGIVGGERSLSAARTVLNPSKPLSRRVSSSSSRARFPLLLLIFFFLRAGGWKPRAIVTSDLLLNQWRLRRHSKDVVVTEAIAAPLLVEGAVYFFGDNVPSWNVPTDPKEAREIAKFHPPIDDRVEPPNSTCVFARNGTLEGRICERDAALKCTYPLIDDSQVYVEGGAGYEIIDVYFFCGHNETCHRYDCTDYYDEVDSGVTFAIAFFCFLVLLAIIFLLRECYHAYKFDKQFRANIADHEPLYLTTRRPVKELNAVGLGERNGKRKGLREVNEDPMEMQHALTLTMNLPSIDEVDDDDGDD